MIRVIERLATDFKSFGPELVAAPKTSLYRIYRDTRFSPDKTPLKTNVAASFPWRGLHRHQGAGLYFEIAPTWVWIGGGMYAPEPPHLVKVREHIAETWPEIRKLTRARAFVARFETLGGEQLTRVPARLPRGSSGRRFPPSQAVPRRPRAASRICHPRGLLFRAPLHVQSTRAAGPVSQRAARRGRKLNRRPVRDSHSGVSRQ